MKKCISLLLSLFLAMGCSKNNSIDSVTYQSTLLVNNTYNIGKWKLATLVIGKVVQSLTPAQIAYVKYYKEDLKFSDSDGSMGTWRIPASTRVS
jgi:uncharacterized protein YcfL